MNEAIIGQETVVERLLITLLADGQSPQNLVGQRHFLGVGARFTLAVERFY
jgi:hypothetical protein